MIRIPIALRWLRGSAGTHRVQLALCVRVTTAAVLTLLLAQVLRFRLYASKLPRAHARGILHPFEFVIS